jgi:hypothetical protein
MIVIDGDMLTNDPIAFIGKLSTDIVLIAFGYLLLMTMLFSCEHRRSIQCMGA